MLCVSDLVLGLLLMWVIPIEVLVAVLSADELCIANCKNFGNFVVVGLLPWKSLRLIACGRLEYRRAEPCICMEICCVDGCIVVEFNPEYTG